MGTPAPGRLTGDESFVRYKQDVYLPQAEAPADIKLNEKERSSSAIPAVDTLDL